MNIDKRDKENIRYIGDNIMPLNLDNINYDSMYGFIKNLNLALCEPLIEIDECEEPLNLYNPLELTFIAQDLADTFEKKLVTDYIDASNRNVAIELNANNYINLLAGALKSCINKVELLEQEMEKLSVNNNVPII